MTGNKKIFVCKKYKILTITFITGTGHQLTSMCDECKSQGQAKAMCWVGLLDGKAIGPFWVDGTMDRFVYADLLEEKVWPAVSRIATRNSVYFMLSHHTRKHFLFE